MYVDEKKLEGKNNASSDVITSSLSLSRDTDLVMCHAFQQWGNRVFNRSFRRKDELLLQLHPLFNWLEEIQQLVCWPEELDDKWSQKSASF